MKTIRNQLANVHKNKLLFIGSFTNNTSPNTLSFYSSSSIITHSPLKVKEELSHVEQASLKITNKDSLTNGDILLARALEHFRSIVGATNVATDEESLSRELADCSGNIRNVPAIVYPTSHDQVVQIVKIANRYQVPLNPVSSGQNWGYGSALPATNQRTVLLKMSKMTRLDMDEENGVAHVEPGVTQQQLLDYLQERNLDYTVPVTGAGPTCSLLSNALERGYGISPYIDHFGAATSMRIVLPTGNVHESMLDKMGGKHVSTLYKWQTGPYLEGLFSQSNLGIVTKMSIALYPKPEKVESFFFFFDDLSNAVSASKEILRCSNGIIGSVKLINNYAMVPMAGPYPKDQAVDGMLPQSYIDSFCKKNQFTAWNGVGNLYGSSAVIKAARSDIKKILRRYGSKRNIFLSANFVHSTSSFLNQIPIVNKTHLATYANVLSKSLELFSGIPNETGLRIAYWKSGERPTDKPWNPSKDGAGIIWYNPLIPITPQDLNSFTSMVNEICKKHKTEPLMTLTSLSDRCCVGTIPLLFDRNNEEEMKRAQVCYHELMNAGQKLGYVPYRLGIQSVNWLQDNNAVPPLLQTLKKTLDPNNILSPGKYGIF
ncbi:hypothetical protein NAEGRDRAFT_51010 [Naegleria gruberi]|uniref:D-lactate dehydrogenase (cytochrome) n=1 Tax=Naegleria gruberi TaxID=5762 RepID=D2VNJ0_NAEGR|nr:uncharacterized protein NAEGRDRAFT_51010 [Naegleria gruberi]EFC41745.1 hypothetical protein NAEGRDRAFT_51010 [Naegleria gruberi]|eukprot:XP_002674489.1 hypothetical protein NAEGRDRAFT_51010 [Naegleria gruberi strain NEG-M]